MTARGDKEGEDSLLSRELTPGDIPEEIQRNLQLIRQRVARAYEAEIRATEEADPQARQFRAARLEALPKDHTQLQVKHVVAYAEDAVNALESIQVILSFF